MLDLDNVYPKLRNDSVVLPTDEGVLLRNSRVSLELKGKQAYRGVSALLHHLDGDRSVEELCTGLPQDRRDTVTRLLSVLLENGLVKNSRPDHPLSEPVRRRFASQIDYVDQYLDRPVEGFLAFRESSVLVMGEGIAFSALSVGLLRNGLRTLSLLTPQSATVRNELDFEIRDLRGRLGGDASYRILEANRSLPDCLDGFRLVIYCSDCPSLGRVHELNRVCREKGVEFLPGFTFGGRVLIGPLVTPRRPGCWLCAQMRLASNMQPIQAAQLWMGICLDEPGNDNQEASYPTNLRMLGNAMAFEAFKYLIGGLQAEADGWLLIQDLHTLEASRSRLLPHPKCPVCSTGDPASHRSGLMAFVRGERDCQQVLERRSETLLSLQDPAVGLFRSLCEAADARSNAVLKAAARYVETNADPRWMVFGTRQELVAMGFGPVACQKLSTWSGGPAFGDDERIGWLPAHSRPADAIHYVPAAAVYPYSAFNRRGVFRRSRAGHAAGWTFDEFRNSGLLSALRFDAFLRLVAGDLTAAHLDIRELATRDHDLARLIDVSSGLCPSMTVMQIRGELAAPVCLVFRESETQPRCRLVGLGIGVSQVQSAKEAILESLESPADGEGEMWHSVEFVLPTALPLSGVTVSERYCETSDPITPDQIDKYLVENDRQVLVVNTTTSDIWDTRSILTGVVLITGSNETIQQCG